MAFDLADYVTVPERVRQFYEMYPDGRILNSVPEIRVIGERQFIEVTTSVYRSPEDALPCVASAWEPFPGKTPFTKDSEMMNAETSATGRAIAAAGIAVNRSLASQEEVKLRTETPKPRTQQKQVERPALAESAPQSLIDSLVERMERLPDDRRKICKNLFVAKFGKPSELSSNDAVAAEVMVGEYES
jgi:hypothetical protein